LVLSLKFRPHMATRTPHCQNRSGVIHGTGLLPQHCKRAKNYTKWPKNWRVLYRTWVRAHMRVTKMYNARISARCTAIGRKNRVPTKRRIYWNWSASQPLMDQLPSWFDTKSELNPHGGLVKDLIEP
jgi:hypothetical protein